LQTQQQQSQGSSRLQFDDDTNTLIIQSDDNNPSLKLRNDVSAPGTNTDLAILSFQGNQGGTWVNAVNLRVESTASWGASANPSRLEIEVNDYNGATLHSSFEGDGTFRNKYTRTSNNDSLVEGGYNKTSNIERKIVSSDTSGTYKTVIGGRMLMEKYDAGTLDWSNGDTTAVYDNVEKTFWEGSINNINSSGDLVISISDNITGSFYPGDIFLWGIKIFGVTSGTVTLKAQCKLNGNNLNETLYDAQANPVTITTADDSQGHIIMGQLTYWKRDNTNYGFFPSSHFQKLE
jgi:hypothetical protein